MFTPSGVPVVLLLVAIPVSLQGQEPRKVGTKPSCEACGVALNLDVSLSGEDAAPVSELTQVLAMDTRGRFYLVPTPTMDHVVVFGPEGSQIGRIGPHLSGTGGLSAILGLAVSAGDSVHVFEGPARRWLVLSPSYQLARTSPIPGIPKPDGVRILPDGSAVVNSLIRTPDLFGFPLHILDVSGTAISSFGNEGGRYRPDDPGADSRRLALSVDDGIWSAHPYRYEIEYWSLDGEKRFSLVKSVDWAQQGIGPSAEIRSDTPPFPSIRDLRQTQDGLLWVLLTVPDGRWRQALTIDSRGGRPAPWPGRWKMYVDTFIEVIDPSSGDLIISERVDEFFFKFLGDGLLASFEEREGFEGAIGVWRVEITYPPSGREP